MRLLPLLLCLGCNDYAIVSLPQPCTELTYEAAEPHGPYEANENGYGPYMEFWWRCVCDAWEPGVHGAVRIRIYSDGDSDYARSWPCL